MANKLKLRQTWLFLHRWTGLIGLVGMAILGLTGSALVWPDKTEELIYGGRFSGQPAGQLLSVDEYTASAMAALPEGDRISAMRLPVDNSQAVLVGGAPHKVNRVGPPARHRVWLNPQTGELTASAGLGADFMWYMHAYHGHFGMKGLGRDLVGIFGFVLCFSVFTGVWLWWPKNGDLKKAIRWKRSPSQLSNLHHMVGFWSAVPMMILAFTGAYIVFPAFFGFFVSLATGQLGAESGGRGHGAEPPIIPPAEITALAPSEAAGLALREAGGGQVAFMAWPTEARPVWAVEIACETELPDAHEPCRQMFQVEDTTGLVRRPPPEDAPSAAQSAATLMDEIHAGHVGGPVWQIIIFLAGFILTALSLTGIYMWWKMRAGRIRVQALRRERAQAAE
ncbi:MAG: PepSY domain-containing protein [Hyphomonadaceae bacterium]|nr:PepSY domain-containing protein [Hyphomonadaceae bacterium]